MQEVHAVERDHQVSDKQYLDAQTLLEDSFRLGAEIYRSGFRPTFIVAIWRGGAPIGIVHLHDLLRAQIA